MKSQVKILAISCLLMIALVCNLFGYSTETSFAFAKENASDINNNEDINIISDTDVLVQCAKEWARRRGATQTFIDLADMYYKYAKEHGGVNPAIAYVQAAKETAYGRYGSVLKADSHNPCGLKMTKGGGDYDASIHMRFDSWDDGVKAHLDHLALYAGAEGYPLKDTKDPRHFSNLFGKCKTVKSLGGCYAPSKTYGDEVLELYYSLVSVDKQYRGYVIKNLPAIGSIDSINTDDMLDRKKIVVNGFVISGPSINQIELYAGGILKAVFKGDMDRPDVKSMYPLYNTETCGFSTEIDVSDLEQKEQEIKLICRLDNGSSYEISKNFLLEKKPPLSDQQLKKIENTISIVVDDDIYKEYSDYILGKTLGKPSHNAFLINELKEKLSSRNYNVLVVNNSIDNNKTNSTSDTFKDRASIRINNITLGNNDNDSKNMYHLSPSLYDDFDNTKLICEDMALDFEKTDNTYDDNRTNSFSIISSNISGVKIDYYISKKNIFNDNNEKSKKNLFLDKENSIIPKFIN